MYVVSCYAFICHIYLTILYHFFIDCLYISYIIIAFDPNTNDIVGAAYDAFDPDVIVEEFNNMKREAAAANFFDDDGEDDDNTLAAFEAAFEEKKEESVAKGEHYMVFAFQNWSGKHKHIHFVAARYNLAKLSSRWLRKALHTVICCLGSFSIYGIGVAYDGASENRAWGKRTLTITLREMVPELLDEASPASTEMAEAGTENRTGTSLSRDTMVYGYQEGVPLDKQPPPLNPTVRKFSEAELPWDMPVAYPHPSVKGLIIIALADFSHCIKKVTNSVETGNLKGIGSYEISMHSLKDCYMACPDMTTQGKSYKFVFVFDSYHLLIPILLLYQCF